MTLPVSLFFRAEFSMELLTILTIIGLAAQVTMIQALQFGRIDKGLILEKKSSERPNLVPEATDFNRAFSTDKFAASVHNLSLNLDESIALGAETNEKKLNARARKVAHTSEESISVPSNVTSDPELEHNRRAIFEKFRRRMLYQFHKMDTNLEHILLTSSRSANPSFIWQLHGELRRKRNAPRGSRPECTVSKDQLKGLRNQINSALANATEIGGSTNCEFSDGTNTENCVELIKLVQCGINHLKAGFIEEINKNSSIETEKWKNVYGNMFQNFQKQLDDSKQSIVQSYGREIDSLKKSFQAMNELLQNTDKQLKINRASLCASEIGNGRINEAITEFEKLKDDYALKEIVYRVYNDYGQIKQVENICKFIKALRFCQRINDAYLALLQAMDDHNHLGSPELLIPSFQASVSSCTIDSLRNFDLEKLAENIITAWATKIRENKEYDQIIDFEKRNPSAFKYYHQQLVDKSYASNLKNIKALLKFSRDLTYFSTAGSILTHLYKEMDLNNHLDSSELIMLAYQVNVFMKMANYDSLNREHKDLFITLQDNLPSSIESLIFDDNEGCRISNRVRRNDMVCSSRTYDGDRREISTTLLPKYQWKLLPENNAEHFLIYNVVYKEYLYGASDAFNYDSERRRGFTWRPGTKVIQGRWKLEPLDNGQYFTIYNTIHNEYLYGASDYFNWGTDSGKVFTWIPGTNVETDEWDISC